MIEITKKDTWKTICTALSGRVDELQTEINAAYRRLAKLEARLTEKQDERKTRSSGSGGVIGAYCMPGDRVQENAEGLLIPERIIGPTESPRPKWATWRPTPWVPLQSCIAFPRKSMALAEVHHVGAQEYERAVRCTNALDSRPGLDPIRDPEKARDVVEAARERRRLEIENRYVGVSHLAGHCGRLERARHRELCAIDAFERAQRGE